MTRTLLNSASSNRTNRYLQRQFKEVMARQMGREAAKRAAIKAQLRILKFQLESQSTRRGRPVRIDPNERFAHIEDFMRAQEEERVASERAEARACDAQRRLAINPEATARENQQFALDQIYSEFQL